MKAKEYIEKHFGELDISTITEKELSIIAIKIYKEMFIESHEILIARHGATDNAITNIFHEQNEKWNAIRARMDKKYGFSLMAKDGFMIMTEKRFSVNK